MRRGMLMPIIMERRLDAFRALRRIVIIALPFFAGFVFMLA